MEKISNALNQACEILLATVLSVMAVAVLLEVIFRYVLHLPLFWTEEFARYCLVWASLIGAAVALKKGDHIAVTLLLERCPRGMGRVMTFAARFSVSGILFVMLWGGIKLVFVTSSQISPALRIPMAVPYLALPISAAIMLFHMITAVFYGPGVETKGACNTP